jgi:hypothetical protein
MATEMVRHLAEQSGGSALPDNAAYTNRFEIRSETSDSVYVVAQSKKGRWWSCECFGFRRHKHCKHLRNLGLPGNYQAHEPQLPAKV